MCDLFVRLFINKPGRSDISTSTIADIPARAYQSGSGSLMFHIQIDDVEINLVVSGAILFEHISERRTSEIHKGGLSTLGEACAHHVVPIHLRVGTAEVKLADVITLEVGDVLTLDQKIADPVKLMVAGETVEHRSLLGKVGANKAVRLLAK